jgi:hypothetical protein
MWSRGHYCMIGQLAAALIVIIVVMILVNTIKVIAQSQNVTNETGIGENQSISGRISGFGGDLGFGPRVIDELPK